MDSAKRGGLIKRIKMRGLPSPDRPLPLVAIEEFFVGNGDYGSIGCNLVPMLGPQFFFEELKLIRSRPNVQNLLVEGSEVEEEDLAAWPFADRVYIFTDGKLDDVARWTLPLQADLVEEGFGNGKPEGAPELKPGYKCYSIWWD